MEALDKGVFLLLGPHNAKKGLKFNSLSTRTLKSKGIHSLWYETWILAFQIGWGIQFPHQVHYALVGSGGLLNEIHAGAGQLAGGINDGRWHTDYWWGSHTVWGNQESQWQLVMWCWQKDIKIKLRSEFVPYSQTFADRGRSVHSPREIVDIKAPPRSRGVKGVQRLVCWSTYWSCVILKSWDILHTTTTTNAPQLKYYNQMR